MKKSTPIVVAWTLLVVAVLAPAIAQEDEAPSRILITNVNVWDGTSDGLQSGMNVLITGNLIESVSKSKPSAPGATVIDGGGRTLMPGLIDMHSHLCLGPGGLPGFRDAYDQVAAGAWVGNALLQYLDQGFTTARDAGCNILGVAKAVRNGLYSGPRIFPSGGFISQTGGRSTSSPRCSMRMRSHT